MSTEYGRLKQSLEKLLEAHSIEELNTRLTSKSDELPTRPTARPLTPRTVDQRWHVLGDDPAVKDPLLDPQTLASLDSYKNNIENFIGTVKLPVGIAGPLRVNGLHAQGDYYIPLATTEAALVASYSRGMQTISDAGGCRCMLLAEGVSRAPGFAFLNLKEAGLFVVWIVEQLETLKSCAEVTSRYAKLMDLKINIEGNHVYLIFEYSTGDAAGQNMVTIATDAICQFIQQNSPIIPQYYFLEANMSGDKKASMQSFLTVRGKKVTAEIVLQSELISRRLRTTAATMANYWRMSALGGVMIGTVGVQGHYANGLAALYIACGQDAACVSESSVGVTRMEVMDDGSLYTSVTLPNLIVGTVGGGTSLPSQKACLEIMGLFGTGHGSAFAEVCAGVALAGELSIIAALCSGDFSQAHQRLARGKTISNPTENHG